MEANQTVYVEIPDDASFDSYTEQDEQQAIEQAAAQLENKYRLVGQKLWARFPSGNKYFLPLNVDVTRFQNTNATADPVEQVHNLIATINPDDAQRINSEPFMNVVAFSVKYANVFEQVQAASLGKLTSSAKRSKHTQPNSAPTSPSADGASPRTSEGD